MSSRTKILTASAVVAMICIVALAVMLFGKQQPSTQRAVPTPDMKSAAPLAQDSETDHSGPHIVTIPAPELDIVPDPPKGSATPKMLPSVTPTAIKPTPLKPDAEAVKRQRDAAKLVQEKAALEKSETAASREKKTTPDKTVPSGSTDLAKQLYVKKKFAEAAKTVGKKSKSFNAYSGLAKNYNVAMNGNPTSAFGALRAAIGYDKSLDQAFVPELEDRISKVAPSAVSAFLAKENWEEARKVLNYCDANAISNSTTELAKKELVSQAQDMVKEAKRELATDADAAKEKLKRVLRFMPAGSAQYAAATEALAN
jgi:hypothetical protein